MQPPVALKIANDLKNLGTAAYKETDYFTAQIKCISILLDPIAAAYPFLPPTDIKALRYMDLHPVLATRDLTLEKSFADLKLSLLLNSALAALKTSTPLKAEDARLAIKQTTRALGMDGDEIKNPGLKVLTDAEKGKALYRRAVGYGVVKEDEKSIADLEQALKYVPGDAAISKEFVDILILRRILADDALCRLQAAKKRVLAVKEQKRKAYGKMFA